MPIIPWIVWAVPTGRAWRDGFSHTLDRAKVTALIDQFNKMKEEGKVMDAFTFSFMGNQALVHGSQRVARAAYQLINESYPDAPGRRITCIIWR